MSELSAINVPIKKTLKNNFKARCAIKGENMTIVVSKLIENYMDQGDKLDSELMNV